MTHPIIPGLYRVTINQSRDAKALANVVFVQRSGVNGDELNVGRAVQRAWAGTTSIAAVQTTVIHYENTVTQCWGTLTEGVSDTWAAAQTSGRVASALSGSNMALCVTLKTSSTGRRNRGRLYIGGLPQANTTTNAESWNLAASHMTDLMDNFMSNLVAETPSLNLYIFSRLDQAAKLVTATKARAGIATQRRRARRYATP